MRVRHPYSLDDDAPIPDGTVHWGGRREWSDVDEDGTFYVPDEDARAFVERWPEADGYAPSDLLVTDEPEPEPEATCAGTTADGEPCSNPAGEDGYCRYHGEDDGE